MLRSKTLHVLVSVLFLVQTLVPVRAFGVSSVESNTTGMPEHLIQSALDTLDLETRLLGELSVEMAAALDEIRATYPKQFSLWSKILQLPTSPSTKQEIEKEIGITTAVIQSVASYARHIFSLQNEYSKNSEFPEQLDNRQILNNVKLSIVLPLQEKIRTYELINQGKINEINNRIRTVYDLKFSPEIFTEMNTLEKQRSRLVNDYTKLLTKYESIKIGIIVYRERSNEGLNNTFKEELNYYSELIELLTSETQSAKTQFKSVLLKLSRNKSQELQAALSISTEGQEGISWPLFKNVSSKKAAPHDVENNVLNDLYRALKQMTPRLKVLGDILTARNKLLYQTDFIQNEDRSWLRYQIGLEDLRIEKLSETLDQLKQLTSSNQNEASLLEELGVLKEDILAIETIILDELVLRNKDDVLWETTEGWQINKILELQKEWQHDWKPIEAEFDYVVANFKDYQRHLLEDTIQTATILNSDIRRISKRLVGKKDQELLSSFLSLFGAELSEKLIQTKEQLDTRNSTMKQEKVDPLFHYVFGNRPERFWHDYRSMGVATAGLERLRKNKSKIRANILALASAKSSSDRQVLLVLKLIQQCDIVNEVSYNENNCSVIIGSGPDNLIIDNLWSDSPATLKYFSIKSSESAAVSIVKTIFSVLRIVSPAHASAWSSFTKWNSTVFNQMKKNWVGYAVSGVVIVTAAVVTVAAAPVIAAATATAAVATATTAAVVAGASAMAVGGASAFYAQATADVALGTSRYMVNEMDFSGNEYATKKNWNTVLDAAETTYNITKLAEGIKNIVSPGDTLEEVADQVSRTRAATDAAKASKLRHLEGVTDTADEVRKQLAALEQITGKTPQQVRDLLRTKRHLVHLERTAAEVSEQIANITQKGAQNIENIHTASNITFITGNSRTGSQIAEGFGLPNALRDSINGVEDLVNDKGSGGAEVIPDLCPGNPLKKLPGKCGCDEPETDSDNDKTPDCIDECDDNPKLIKEGKCGCEDEVDSDGDGTPDCIDECDDNPKLTKEGKCGCEDEVDADKDGIPSCIDKCDNDPQKIEEGICGCNIPDDATDSNENGIPDCKENTSVDQDVSDLRNAENQEANGLPQKNDPFTFSIDDYFEPGKSSPWQPSVTDITANERINSANATNAANQIKNDAQNQAAAYQAGQAANQAQRAESINQIKRERDAQLTDAVIGGFTSGIAEGIGTFGERVGQGASVKISQSITGDKHHSDSHSDSQVDSQVGCEQDADCSAGNTCNQGVCIQKEETIVNNSGASSGSGTSSSSDSGASSTSRSETSSPSGSGSNSTSNSGTSGSGGSGASTTSSGSGTSSAAPADTWDPFEGTDDNNYGNLDSFRDDEMVIP